MFTFIVLFCFVVSSFAENHVIVLIVTAPKKIPMIVYTAEYLANAYKNGHEGIIIDGVFITKGCDDCNYPDMLCDFVPQIEQKRLTGITLSFVREASYGQTVELLRGEREGGYAFRALRPDGTVCLEALLSLEPIATECPKGGAGGEAQSEN